MEARTLIWDGYFAAPKDRPLPFTLWTTGCNQDPRYPAVQGWCHLDLVAYDRDNPGNDEIEVEWHGSISSSWWADALWEYRYVMQHDGDGTGDSFAPGRNATIAEAKRLLAARGL